MYNEVCPPNSTQYVVKKDDTLWKLSGTYGISVQSILDANPDINPQNLQIGSTLCIPAVLTSPASPTTCPEGTFSHTVQADDILWKLSRAYGVSVQSILDLNPGVNPQNLQIGSTLCIPAAQAPLTPPHTCPKGAIPYTVQADDTLWKLSQTYGVSIQSILDLNPSVNPQNLQIGATLCIPVAPTPQTSPIQSTPTTPSTPLAPSTLTKPLSPSTSPIQSTPTTPSTPLAPSTLTKPLSPSTSPIQSTPTTPSTPLVPSTLTKPTKPSTSPIQLTPTKPSTQSTPVASPSDFAYLIKKCDSICGIARKFYVSAESILQINPGIDLGCLQAGTYIYVPINCCSENAFRYTVRPGDTLNRIANRFNVCPSALIEANPNIDFEHLARCQIICIPNA